MTQDTRKPEQTTDDVFQLAVKGSSAGIWDWIDVNENEEWWSPRFYELLGYQPGEIDASLENFSKMLHPEDSKRCFDLVDKHFKKEADFILEYRLKTKSGKYKWFLGSGQAKWDKSGKPTRMVGAIVDIDDKKEAERKLKEQNRELQAKNKVLEQFVYIASHDLQEPLRTINSFSNLLEKRYGDKIDDDGKTYLKYLRQSALKMNALLSGLLDYSRLGKENKKKGINLQAVASKMLDKLSYQVNQSDAEITMAELPTVSGYEKQLEILFYQLLDNAIKFRHPEKKPQIEISAEKVEGGWRFAVSDNGIGIDDKFADKVFNIFRRLHTSSEYPGIGIGLALSEKIVEYHHGKIWLISTPGEGTTIFFTIAEEQ